MARPYVGDEIPMCALTVRWNTDTHELLRSVARAKARSMNELAVEVLTAYLIAQDQELVDDWTERERTTFGNHLRRARRRAGP